MSTDSTTELLTDSLLTQSAESLDWDALELPESVREKVRQVLPSEDALDRVDFDPIAYINELFPDEHSLLERGSLSRTVHKLNNEAAILEAKLSTVVRKAAFERAKSAHSVKETSSYVRELFDKISGIKEKALESEQMVEDICADIRKLDNAKQNLLSSISTLQKLHMLVTCVAQLKHDALHHSYERAAHLIGALNDFFNFFKDYMGVPQLKKLKNEMTIARLSLSDAIFHEFQRFDARAAAEQSDAEAAEEKMERLSHACAVIDVIGASEKKQFLDFVCTKELQAYGAIYCPGAERAGLGHLEKRFEWLRASLLKYNEFGMNCVFLGHWNVPGLICLKWCEVTRTHLTQVMRDLQLSAQMDLDALVVALEQCVLFEKELVRLYAVSKPEDVKEQLRKLKQVLGEDCEDSLRQKELAQTMTAADIRKKYAVKEIKQRIAELEEAHKRKQAAAGGLLSAESSECSKLKAAATGLLFEGALSNCFQEYMHYYVSLERKNIEQLLTEMERDEVWSIASAAQVSSDSRYMAIDSLLAYIKKSIERCSKIGTDKTFFDIYQEYCRGLETYAQMLERHTPSPVAATQRSSFVRLAAGGSSDEAVFSDSQLFSACLVVNTAFYLSEIIPGLESRVKDTLQRREGEHGEGADDGKDAAAESGFSEKVSMAALAKRFEDTSANGLQTIALGLSKKMDAMLQREVAGCRKWSELERTDDQSSFIPKAKAMLRRNVSIFHEMVSNPTFYSFCDNWIAKHVMASFLVAIFKIKTLNEVGGHQLQIDATLLKALLNNLPHLGFDESDAELTGLGKVLHRDLSSVRIRVSKAYRKQIVREMGKVEAMLKTLAANFDKVEVLADTFQSVTQRGNVQDLARICDIRGLTRREKDEVLRYYNRKVAPESQSAAVIATIATKDDIFGRLSKLSFFGAS